MRQLHFVHAGTVVGNVHNPMLAVLSDIDSDGAAFGTVIDGVADNVVKRAVQIAFVGADRGIFGNSGFDRKGNGLFVLLGDALVVFHDVFKEGDELQAFFFQRDIGCFQTGKRQQFANQGIHAGQFAFQPFQVLFLLLRLRLNQSDNRLHTRQG